MRKQKVGSAEPPSGWLTTIKAWQEADPVLQLVGTWTERPSWAEIARERPEVKYFWSRWSQLRKIDGVWYYRWKEPRGEDRWESDCSSGRAAHYLERNITMLILPDTLEWKKP